MNATFAYDDDNYDPPAPIASLRVSNPTGASESGYGVLITALVDTGADATVIPEDVAEQLGLPVVGYAEIAGVGGAQHDIAMHAALVNLAGVEVMLRVAAFEDERIVGRDLLGHLVARRAEEKALLRAHLSIEPSPTAAPLAADRKNVGV